MGRSIVVKGARHRLWRNFAPENTKPRYPTTLCGWIGMLWAIVERAMSRLSRMAHVRKERLCC